MSFLLLDSLLATGRPTSAELGLINCDVLYQGPLYDEGFEGETTAPDFDHAASLMAATVADYVVLDIESVINQADYIALIEHLRTIRPEAQISIYGFGPRQVDGIGVSVGIGHASYNTWQSNNDSDAPLLAVCDFAAPSLYFRHGRIQQTYTCAAAHITEGRRVNDGKPMIPFIWANYIESLALPKADQVIGDMEWRRWLDFIWKGEMAGINLGDVWSDTWYHSGLEGAQWWSNIVPWTDYAFIYPQVQAFQAAVAAEAAPTEIALHLSE